MEVDAPQCSTAMNYIVSAHKPTAVLKSVVGHFTSPTDLNLIVAKSTRIEIFTNSSTGHLDAVLDIPIYGRISTLELFRPHGAKQDLLFVLLERYKYCILEFDTKTKDVTTAAQGTVKDNVGRPTDNGQLAVVDPECRCIVMQLYDGLLKVVPMDSASGKVGEAFNARVEELTVLDISMMAGCERPTVAVLYEDSKQARHLKAYEVNLAAKDLAECSSSYSQQNLDGGASLLVPVPTPLGGVMVLGEHTVTYVAPQSAVPARTAPIRPSVITAWGRVDADGSRVLISDSQGLLYLVVLAHEEGKVMGLKLQLVGRTSSASSLSYLDAGLVFVGSRQGDSQLIRLCTTPPDPQDPESYVQVLDVWPNLGPIVDLAVVDLDRQGQGQVVCCSGCGTDGSLRVVRNGVGISENAAVELQGIRGVWSLRPRWSSPYHQYLVLAFVGETRVLAINEENELDETVIGGFSHEQLTLWCGNMAADCLVQVTPTGVRCVAASTNGDDNADRMDEDGAAAPGPNHTAQWAIPAGASNISVAAGNPTQVVVAMGVGRISVLQVERGDGSAVAVAEVAQVTLDADVACVDITPTGGDPLRASVLAVGTWNMAVHLYRLPTTTANSGNGSLQPLQLLVAQQLEGEVIPRSVMLWCFEGVPHLLVGMGDGQLQHWKCNTDTGALSDRKKLHMGSKPVLLRPFRTAAEAAQAQQAQQQGAAGATGDVAAAAPAGPNGGNGSSSGGGGAAGGSGGGGSSSAAGMIRTSVSPAVGGSVFAASDRPAVLYSTNKKLMYANLNENEVTHIAPFNSASFPDSLAIAKEGSLTIGTVDAIQRLHIRALPLHEQARRVVHQESTRTLGVICITNLGLADESGAVRVYDVDGMELRASYALGPNELGCAITSCRLGGEEEEEAAAGAAAAAAGDNDHNTFYVVGTAIVRPEETEPSAGRLLVLQYAQGKLTLVCEKTVRGAVYEVVPFQGGRLLNSCNSKVQVQKWIQREDGAAELQQECSASGHVLALYLAARGDHVLVGDLMRSLSLYMYKLQEGVLELRAQDFSSTWCTAIAMLDDDTYLTAENSYNLVLLRKQADAASEDERSRLELVGEYHLGEFVNRLRPGSLVSRLPDSELANVPTWLFGTIDGTLGVLASLPPQLYEFVSQLQEAMRKVVKGVGGLSHAEWRAFCNERRSAEARGFVDGDLVESFLELDAENAHKVVQLMGGSHTVEEVVRKVEELTRLH